MYVDLAQNRQTLSFVSHGTVALKSFVAHEDESAREREREREEYVFIHFCLCGAEPYVRNINQFI